MIWTVQKLNEFKNHFILTDSEIGRGLGLSPQTIRKMRYGDKQIEGISHRLTGYMEAVREGRIREAEKMIEYFKAF